MRKLGSDGYNSSDRAECGVLVEKHKGSSISIQCLQTTDVLCVDFVIQKST